LSTDRVRLFSLRKREEFGKAELMADWGVTPEQVVDLQALVGDSVDNVPGVPGIGIKTGAKLLQEFGTLDNLLKNVDKVPGKKQQSLRESGDKVALSRQLVRLDCDMPLEFDWEGWKLQPIAVEPLLALCREWGFQSLSGQIRALARTPVAAGPTQGELFAAPSSPEEELFPFGANEPTPDGEAAATEEAPEVPAAAKKGWKATYHLVDTFP